MLCISKAGAYRLRPLFLPTTFLGFRGQSLQAHGLEDALVDEVGLAALHLAEDVVHLLRGTEPIVVHPLALAPGAFPGTAPTLFLLVLLYLCVKLHNVKNLVVRNNVIIFAEQNPKWEGFPSRGLSNRDFKSHFDYPNPN